MTITDNAALYRLMAWLSPSYPVGAFSYSHGIEWLVEEGSITNLDTLVAWLDELLTFGSGRNDALLFAAAWRAASSGHDNALDEINALALALAPSAERHLETAAQGRAFSDITRNAWDSPTLTRLAAASPVIAYPVAVGIAAADHGIGLDAALHAYLHGFAANLISAGVRLIPLGHTDGQRALRAMEPITARIATLGRDGTLDDLGSSAFAADLAAMKHETQYTRLFRS